MLQLNCIGSTFVNLDNGVMGDVAHMVVEEELLELARLDRGVSRVPGVGLRVVGPQSPSRLVRGALRELVPQVPPQPIQHPTAGTQKLRKINRRAGVRGVWQAPRHELDQACKAKGHSLELVPWPEDVAGPALPLL